METRIQPSTPWWRELYDKPIADLFLERDDTQVQRETAILVQRLNLNPGDLVFDQCCGNGIQGLAMARQGFTVHGVDQAREYITSANAGATRESLNATFTCADACRYQPPGRFHGGYNWGTSFGNGLAESDHQAMLQAAYKALRPGGYFALEFPNMAHLLCRFQPVMTRRKQREDGEWLVVRESTLDLHEGALRQLWTILAPGGDRRTVETTVRLYLPHQLRCIMEQAGFEDVQLYSALENEALTDHHARCLAVGRAP